MKRIAGFLLTLTLLAGCAGKPEDTAAPPVESAAQADAASASAETPQPGGGETFTIYSWEGMFPEEILSGFEKETGYKINYADFDFDETMLAKLEAAGGGDYDLVIADDYIIEIAIAEGLLQKLDTGRIKNYANINPIYQKQFYDPADEYTIPYGAGVLTLISNPAEVSMEINSFADLWHESLRDSVGLIGNYRVVKGMALKVLGQSFNTNDLDILQQAGDKLLELAPNIRLIKDDELQNDLLSGEISAGMLYTSQAFLAKLENPDLRISFPSEGVGFGIMAGFIPSNAPNPDAAYAFLDYILDPARGASCFEWLGFYCTYSASEPFIADEYRALLTLPEGFNVDMEMIENINAAASEKHEQIWTAFKSAAGQ